MKAPVVVLFAVIFFFSSCASITLSQNDGGVPPCLRKLMPCVVFLQSPEKPTGACCIPLKDALENEVACLCDMFGDAALQKSFNVTQKDLLGLPARCGLQPPDLSKCNDTATASSPSPAAAPHPNPNVTSPPPKGAPSTSGSLDIGMSMMSVILFTLIGMYSVTSLF